MDAQDRQLAGLVSDEAERLYARLAAAGGLYIGEGAEQLSLDNNAVRELTEAKIIFPSHNDRLIPVARETALQLLLSRQHAEIARRQEAAVAGWKQLDAMLSESRGPTGTTIRDAGGLADVIVGLDELNHLSHELYYSTEHELLGLTTGRFKRPMELQKAVTPPLPATSQGARFRMIYDSQIAAHPFGAQLIAASVETGEEIRIREQLPLKMLHVDDKVALIALTDTAVDGSLLTRSPLLLAALREWFEYMWKDDSTTAICDSADISLTVPQRHVLRLLSSGMSDEAIARASGMSVRTVRRHVTAILDQLGASSRFAAGAMASRRGWI